jgi:hypothetical protein
LLNRAPSQQLWHFLQKNSKKEQPKVNLRMRTEVMRRFVVLEIHQRQEKRKKNSHFRLPLEEEYQVGQQKAKKAKFKFEP